MQATECYWGRRFQNHAQRTIRAVWFAVRVAFAIWWCLDRHTQRAGRFNLKYPIVIQRKPEGGYRFTVPDLPFCGGDGNTLDEVLSRSHDVILWDVVMLIVRGEPVPLPGDLIQHKAGTTYAGGVWTKVGVDRGLIVATVIELEKKWANGRNDRGNR